MAFTHPRITESQNLQMQIHESFRQTKKESYDLTNDKANASNLSVEEMKAERFSLSFQEKDIEEDL